MILKLMSCVFCEIIKGNIPSYKVYEDDDVYAFLDIAPVSYGHTLVVPKEHYTNMEAIPEEVLRKLITAVKKVGKAVKEGLGVAGYNISENNDPVAGQVIPHIHFHIIPRRRGDGLKLWPQGKYGDGEAEDVAKKIKKSL
jgi:histidine triad (HIT) family protein